MSNHDPDVIVAQARAAVAARRTAEAQQRWRGPWQWLLPLLAAIVPLGLVVVPGTLAEKLLLAMGGIDGLRPTHSYFPGGVQLPLEARDMGIYVGFLVAFVVLLPRLGARRFGSRAVKLVLGVFFASMVFDGVNSTIATVGFRPLYASTNLTRLLTGLLSGIATGALLVWLLGVVALPQTEENRQQVVVRGARDLGVLLVLCGVVAAAVLSGAALAYYPVALLSVAGAVGVLCVTVLLLILRVSRLASRVTALQHLVAPTALALLITYAIFAVFAAYRWTTIGTIPF